MEANAGGETAGKFTTRKGRLFAGASCAALAITCVLPARVVAANYTASNDAELRARISQANGDGDPTSTIVLTASFTTNTTSLPAPTKPITIDTGSFTLSGIGGTGGTAGSTINIIGVAGPSDSLHAARQFQRWRRASSNRRHWHPGSAQLDLDEFWNHPGRKQHGRCRRDWRRFRRDRHQQHTGQPWNDPRRRRSHGGWRWA